MRFILDIVSSFDLLWSVDLRGGGGRGELKLHMQESNKEGMFQNIHGKESFRYFSLSRISLVPSNCKDRSAGLRPEVGSHSHTSMPVAQRSSFKDLLQQPRAQPPNS
jgi:hypothetical protein